MTIQKKPRNSVAIGVGVLCAILLIAIAAIYFDYSSIVTNRDLQITDKSNQISSLNTQVSNIQTWLNGNISEVNSLNAQITTLQSELATGNSQETSLKSQLATGNSQETSLKSQLNSLNTQISNLQTWLNGNVTALATANSQITSLQNQVNSLNPSVEQVRDMTMGYIEAYHNETAQYMQSFSWIGGNITPEGLAGGRWYSYQSSGWNITIQYPVGLPPGGITIYRVTATYTSQVTPGEVIVSWQGTFQNGIITETTYTINP